MLGVRHEKEGKLRVTYAHWDDAKVVLDGQVFRRNGAMRTCRPGLDFPRSVISRIAFISETSSLGSPSAVAITGSTRACSVPTHFAAIVAASAQSQPKPPGLPPLPRVEG